MRILCLGDSIMQYNDFSTYPQTGWVQELARFFPDSTQWLNFARNGRSTKSFIDEGRFDRVMSETRKGDFALIQFAHNDEKDDPTRHTESGKDGEFRKNLSFFVRNLRKKGALPILLTPIARRMYENGKIKNSHGDYPAAIIETAVTEKVPCIDMTTITMDFLETTGYESSRRFYMNFDAGLYENFPEGRNDNSHLRPDGAHIFARLAAQEIQKIAFSFPDYKDISENCMVSTESRFNEVSSEGLKKANEEIDDEYKAFL